MRWNNFRFEIVATIYSVANSIFIYLKPILKGELAVKSDFIMKSYDKRPDATSEAITKEGWLLTGEFILLMSELYYTAGMEETTVIWCGNIDFVLLNRKKKKVV